MKIFCIGRNYADHAKELNNAVPSEPMVFMKPPTALLLQNKAFYIPEFTQNVHHEIEVVLQICKNGKHIQPQFAHKYYNAIGLGIDFTARDIQDQQKKKGHPWEIAKAFDKSAPLGEFFDLEKFPDLNAINFHMTKNGEIVQKGNTSDLIFNFDTLICHLSKYFTLNMGDYIFTGTPAGVGPVQIGDLLEGFLEGEKVLECEIR